MDNKVYAFDCYNKDKDDLYNFQNVEEKLLRLAVKWTEHFATDINILINSLKNYLDLGAVRVEIGFRQYGVNWDYITGDGKVMGGVRTEDHDLYRGKALLVLEGHNITLTWENGNC